MGWGKKITAFLKQPYPFYYGGKNFLLFNLLVFLLALAFNYLIEPFNVYVPEHKMDYFWISLIHSFTPIVVAFLLLPFLWNPKNEENWNLGKEAFLLAIFLFLIGLIQFLIRDIIYDNPNNWSWRYFFEEIRNTFLVGIFMLSILLPWNHNRLNRKNSRKAQELGIVNSFEKQKQSPISIKTQLKGDDFDLNVADFLFAKAEGNYVELHVKTETSTNKLLKRISIKELESQLNSIPHIFRTHRSYLVNLLFIASISGNAQGYRLKLRDSEEMISVSRNMISKFENQLKVI
ncbi:hypothetical protein GGR42_001844 [Saonia flava]|uniref:HTH LytTR-type domain-containing protein n=1 Tax=Saonia flava TaxID=523696 RepID=A0A846QXP2_9FLAO|nr:LytTR family DNA-binding domain-containing protein [Saonia flava]NJB71382.1 hypothetical protein [Saonia flava]